MWYRKKKRLGNGVKKEVRAEGELFLFGTIFLDVVLGRLKTNREVDFSLFFLPEPGEAINLYRAEPTKRNGFLWGFGVLYWGARGTHTWIGYNCFRKKKKKLLVI